MKKFFDPARPWVWALGFLALQIPCLFPQYLSWREADVMAMARNLAIENANPLLPRVDVRGALSGVAPCEPPVYAGLVAVIFRVTDSDAPFWGRLLNLFVTLGALLVLAELGRRWFDFTPGTVIAGSGMVSLFAGFSHNVMPEMTALLAVLCGALAADRWYRTGSWRAALVAAACFAAGFFARPFLVFLGFPVAVLAFTGKTGFSPFRISRAQWQAALIGLIALAPFAFWYFLWSPRLRDSYGLGDYFAFVGRGESYFHGAALLAPDAISQTARTLAIHFFTWFAGPFALLGVLLPTGRAGRGIPRPWIAVMFFIPLIGVLLVTGTHLVQQTYYLFACLPAAIFATAAGLSAVRDRIPARFRNAAVTLGVVFLTVHLSVKSTEIFFSPRESMARAMTEFRKSEVEPRTKPDDLFVVPAVMPFGFSENLYLLRRRGWVVQPAMKTPAFEVECAAKGAKWTVDFEESGRTFRLRALTNR